MSLHSGLLAGFEALVRWQHPELGPSFPRGIHSRCRAVPTDYCLLLNRCFGRPVRRRKSGAVVSLRTLLPYQRKLACQLSGETGMVKEISDLIAENELPAEYLRLEMTESEIMGDPESASHALAHLHHNSA